MKNILVAVDSFKGSMTYGQTANKREWTVTGPLGEPVRANYVWYEREQCRQSGLFDECLAVNDILTDKERLHAMEKDNAVRNLQGMMRGYSLNL